MAGLASFLLLNRNKKKSPRKFYYDHVSINFEETNINYNQYIHYRSTRQSFSIINIYNNEVSIIMQ